MTFVPTKSPINADPVLRRYVEREFQAVSRALKSSGAFVLATDFRGVDQTGTTDSSAGLQEALDSGNSLLIPEGTYLANNLTQTSGFQKLIALGRVHIVKNGNGTLLNSTGTDPTFQGIDFRNDGAGGPYTGDGLVISGDRPVIDLCGGYLMTGVALRCTGAAPQVRGTCNIWRTSTVAGYDIEIGESGTPCLYARLTDIYTSHNDGGLLFTQCGSQMVRGGQFGKYTVLPGTGTGGLNGGHVSAARINGDVSIGTSNSTFSSCLFSSPTITFASGTSGHRMGLSNGFSSGTVIDDQSNESTICDTRLASNKTYTPAWTAVSADPSLGDGTLTGRYMAIGKLVFVEITLTAGASTTFGTGAWRFSLPLTPSTFGQQIAGGAKVLDSGTGYRTGVPVTLADGTARITAQIDGDSSTVDSGRPIAWAAGDELHIGAVFLTN